MPTHEYTYAYAAVDVLGALEDPLSDALLAPEQDTPRVQSMVARDWIINALLKQKLSLLGDGPQTATKLGSHPRHNGALSACKTSPLREFCRNATSDKSPRFQSLLSMIVRLRLNFPAARSCASTAIGPISSRTT